MKILILANNVSGLLGFRRELLERFRQENMSVTVSAPMEERKSELEQLGCKTIDTPVDRRGTNPLRDLKLLQTYRQIIKAEKPDAVLTYTIKPNVYGGLACRMAGIPQLANVTGLGTAVENGGLLSRMVMLLNRSGMRKATCIFFQNAANMAFFKERTGIAAPMRLIPGSGVNLQKFAFAAYPQEDSAVRLSFVGRLMRDKGIGELLEAAKCVKKNHPNVIFELIGGFDEDYREKVDAAVREGTVRYLGVQRDMPPFYAGMWALVMPTYHEGMSNVCLEAAAIGRPVLATLVPGCQETFEDGVTGVGFAARDAEALEKAIEKFLAMPYEEKVAMGRAGREKMEREFDRRLVVDAYMEEINKVERGTV